MNYKICSGEKEFLNALWNVYASFGYTEASFDINEIAEENKTVRLFFDNGSENCQTVILGGNNTKGKAEAVAAAIEAISAAEISDASIELKADEEVKNLLYLYSLDDFIDFSDGEFSLTLKIADKKVMTSRIVANAIVCDYDLSAAAQALADSPLSVQPSKTVIYAEKDADGIAYEISYTLRMMGCLAVADISSKSIDECEKIAIEGEASDIIRVFADGKLQLKSVSTGEITETDYETFIGYYEDGFGAEHSEHDCDCGEHHHHHHDGCDCGCC